MIDMLEILPNEIKIGWKTYNIEYSSAKLNSGDELYGQTNYDTNTITIREHSTPDQMKATLIHEVLHAISEMYGMCLEEKLVTDLANALYTVYKDNIDLAKPEKVGLKKLSDSDDVAMIRLQVCDREDPQTVEIINADSAFLFFYNNDEISSRSYAINAGLKGADEKLIEIKRTIDRLMM